MNWYDRTPLRHDFHATEPETEGYNEETVNPQDLKRFQELTKAIDAAYQNNQLQNVEDMEAELEVLVERITSRHEEQFGEGGEEETSEGYDIEGDGRDVTEGASVEEELAMRYHDYLNFNPANPYPFGSREDIIDNMRDVIAESYGNYKVPDQVLLDAAQDAYNRKLELRQRYQKAFSRSWYKLAKSVIPIYRGEYSGNKGGGYFSVDKEFARQFTQSGQDREIITKRIDPALVYDARTEGLPLPQATSESEFDEAMIKAKELGLYGFRLTEGSNQPDSIYIFNKAILR